MTICAFHFSKIPEAALAIPSRATTTATHTCWSALPLSPSGSSSANIEIPIAVQMEMIARFIVVIGAPALLAIRVARPQLNSHVPIIVTGHAMIVLAPDRPAEKAG